MKADEFLEFAKLLQELYPRAEWNDSLIDLWRDYVRSHDLKTSQAALREMRTESDSRSNSPSLKTFNAIYWRMRKTGKGETNKSLSWFEIQRRHLNLDRSMSDVEVVSLVYAREVKWLCVRDMFSPGQRARVMQEAARAFREAMPDADQEYADYMANDLIQTNFRTQEQLVEMGVIPIPASGIKPREESYEPAATEAK